LNLEYDVVHIVSWPAQPYQFRSFLFLLAGPSLNILKRGGLEPGLLSGWKIMPEDDNLNLKINAAILEQVMNHIR
jgi:hypothetical protein